MPIVLFLFSLLLYIHNLSRSVYGGDVGDLVTAAFTFGTPHPPGYPLFTLLGFLITRVSPLLNLSPAFAVGLISAVASAGVVSLYFVLSRTVTKNTLISLIASLTLATTFLFWFYAEIAEVFALNNFFALSLLTTAYFYRLKGSRRMLYLLALLAGLSATNHHTILFVYPAVLLLIFSRLAYLIKNDRRTLALAVVAGGLGFSVYLYPVIVSQTKPLIDWGNIHSLSSFFDLVLRKKYGTFDLAVGHVVTPTARLVVLKTYVLTMVTQMTIPVVLMSLLGVITLWRKDRTLTLALLLAFLLSGPFFVTYAGFYLTNSFYFGIYERFLSLSTVIFLLFFPSGVLLFTTTLSRFFTRKEYGYLFQGIFILIPIMLFFYNFPKTNLSQTWIGDTLGENHLAVLPQNSILYLSGDTNLFNTWYVRYARSVRPDVDVFNGLSPDITLRQYGDLYGITQKKDFLKLVDTLDTKHPVFSDRRLSGKDLSGTWVPYGLYYEYRSDKDGKLSHDEYKKSAETVWQSMKLPSDATGVAANNFTIAIIPEMYANALVVTGNYFLSEYKDSETALLYYEKALKVDPEYSKTYATLGAFYLTNQKDCARASEYLEKAISLHGFDTRFYYLLYLAYQNCHKDASTLQALRDNYEELFHSSLTVDIKDYETSSSSATPQE